MDPRDILLFIAAVTNLGFASAILFKNPKNPINIGYGLAVIATAAWTAGIAMFRIAGPAEGIAWARFYYLAAGFIATYFLYFGLHFPDRAAIPRVAPWQHALLHLPLAITAYLVFSPSFIASYEVVEAGKRIVLGPAYWFYVLFWISYMAAAFLVMRSRFRAASAQARLQLKFVLAGTLVAAIGGSIFNLFLPLFGNYDLIWVGPYPTLVMVITIGYAIFKHRILDIRIISTEIFSSALLAIFLLQFLRASSLPEFFLQGAILAASTFLFILLIRAMNREVRSREEISVLADHLAAANAELKRLDEAKSEFISIASHQLRAPLTVIKGYVSMFLEGTLGQISTLAQESMKKVAISAEQLIHLVADLLDLSRIEAGRMKYDFGRMVPGALVGEVVAELDATAKAKGIGLRFENRAPGAAVKADAGKIREVVMNLVDNAVKYTSAGEVGVTLDIHDSGGSRRIRIEVRDTGIGIRREDLNRMFTKFARTEEARRLRPDGLGLGLYVVKKIIEDHGGTVSVSSPGLGRGSTFAVELPIVP